MLSHESVTRVHFTISDKTVRALINVTAQSHEIVVSSLVSSSNLLLCPLAQSPAKVVKDIYPPKTTTIKLNLGNGTIEFVYNERILVNPKFDHMTVIKIATYNESYLLNIEADQFVFGESKMSLIMVEKSRENII